MLVMELTGFQKVKKLILDKDFYKRRGHAVLACLSVLWLTIAYIAGVPVNLSIYADMVLMAGLLVILPRLTLSGIESSNKLARNIFGYIFLLIIVFVALGDSYGLLGLPGDSKAEFFTILSHICMVLFGASKIEVSRNAIESVKDSFNWKKGHSIGATNVATGALNELDLGVVQTPTEDSKKVPTPKKKEATRPKQLTKNFSIDEFASRDGVPVPNQYYNNVLLLAKNLQVLRDRLGKNITISSGYRSPAHNAKVGGTKNSKHKLGQAADIQVQGVRPIQVYKTIQELIAQGRMMEGGMGIYKNFVHYDIRGTKTRWDGR